MFPSRSQERGTPTSPGKAWATGRDTSLSLGYLSSSDTLHVSGYWGDRAGHPSPEAQTPPLRIRCSLQGKGFRSGHALEGPGSGLLVRTHPAGPPASEDKNHMAWQPSPAPAMCRLPVPLPPLVK